MNTKTLVCAYGSGEYVKRTFERLFCMYLSNYSKSYTYCALIDLPAGTHYRLAGDESIESKVKVYTDFLERNCEGRFFGAVRQRRSLGAGNYTYACEGGEIGALKALWRFANGHSGELFPIYGRGEAMGVERIYFSAERALKNDGFYRVIEPNGIFVLGSEKEAFEAVLPITGAIETKKSTFWSLVKRQKTTVKDLHLEGLYKAQALDKMLCADKTAVKQKTARVGFVSLPSEGAGFFDGVKENVIL